jgi:hypothetical protein
MLYVVMWCSGIVLLYVLMFFSMMFYDSDVLLCCSYMMFFFPLISTVFLFYYYLIFIFLLVSLLLLTALHNATPRRASITHYTLHVTPINPLSNRPSTYGPATRQQHQHRTAAPNTGSTQRNVSMFHIGLVYSMGLTPVIINYDYV